MDSLTFIRTFEIRSMKKIFIAVLGIGFAMHTVAQDAADKKIQAGVIINTGISFQQMGTKIMEKNGVGSDFSIGANVNFSFTPNIGLCTGLEFDFSSMRYKAESNPIFYRFDDTQILRKDESLASSSLFRLEERTQKANYLTIPTMMLFRTNYIGYFRYFGKFGLRNSFLVSSKINDTGALMAGNVEVGAATEATNDNMKRNSELFFYKGALGLAGGAEWNFAGSTCLVAELGYYYGLTPLYYDWKEDKRSLYTYSATDNSRKYFSNAAKQSQLMLKISILF